MSLAPAKPFLPFAIAGAAGALVASLLPLVLDSGHAESRLLPFQGRLTDANGSAVPDGARVVEFKMYDAPTGGAVKWAGEVHKLSVNGGLVNTLLGSKASLGSLDFAAPTYLQITIDANNDNQITAADPPLLPRQSVVPAVYAPVAGQIQYRIPATQNSSASVASAGWEAVFDTGRPNDGRIPTAKLANDNGITANQIAANAVDSAELNDNAVTSAKILNGTIKAEDLEPGLVPSGVHAGTIVPFAGPKNRLPQGWLLCDGSALRSTNYTTLHQAIGMAWGNGSTHGSGAAFQAVPGQTDFNLPDLRGFFLRGVDDTTDPNALRDVDRGSRFANRAGGNTGGQVGTLQWDEFQRHNHASRTFHAEEGGPFAQPVDTASNSLRLHNATGAAGGSETRPKNAYVNYIIKF